jgi:hypothetical protein
MLTIAVYSVLLGVACGFVTIHLAPAPWELLVWLGLIIALGFGVAKGNGARPFRYGFASAVLAGASITLTHLLFIERYIQSHPGEEAWLRSRDWLESARWVLLAMAPLYWAVLGVLTGVSARMWAKVIRKR